MATVTGYTAERMKKIEDETVVGGAVNNMGNLVLAQRNGTKIDAGRVKGDQGIQGIQGIDGITGGTPAQRDSKFGVPVSDFEKVSLANRVVSWFNATTGWIETYKAKSTLAGLTVAGAPSGGDSGWYPAMQRDLPFAHAGRTAGFQVLGPGLPVIGLTAQTLKGGMTFDTTTNAIGVPFTGWYTVNCQAYFSGALAGSDIGIVSQLGSVNRQIIRVSLSPIPDDTCAHGMTRVYAVAGDTFQLKQQTGNGGQQAWGVDGQNGSYLEVAWYMAP